MVAPFLWTQYESNAVRCSLLSILKTQKSPATLYFEKARLSVFRYFDLWSKIYRLIFSAEAEK